MKILLKKKTNEKEFWKYYLHIRNASSNSLTNRQLEIMVEILAGDPYKSMFKGKQLKSIKKGLELNTASASAYISRMKKELVEKGFLSETGVQRGDVLVAQPLRDFQLQVKKALKEGQPISLELYFEIDGV
jgi:predicted transcriptional regulator